MRRIGIHARKHRPALLTDGKETGTSRSSVLRSGRTRDCYSAATHDREYCGYRKNGQVKKIDDDILSATRVACMAVRHAQTKDRFYGWNTDPRSRSPAERFAIGSANHPSGPYDLFSV
jgi:hypothetical protein